MVFRKPYMFIFLFFVCFSCSTGRITPHQQDCGSITSDEFLSHPFFSELKLKDFREQYGEEFKLKKFRRNLNERNNTIDTIYQYIRGDNAFIFYAAGRSGGASFLTLKVADDRIELDNCVRIGMDRSHLEKLISDFPKESKDTVKIDNGNRQGVFIFKESQLRKVYINNYYK